MRRAFLLIACVLVLSCGGMGTQGRATGDNPFFADYGTPFDVHPFDRIENAHFIPAFEEGMARQNDEIAALVADPEAPTFDNTIAALDRSGVLLDEVSRAFFALSGSNTNDEIQEIQKQISPRLAAHRDEIRLNPELFARVKTVYEQRESLELDREQGFLLEKLYERYVRNGAILEGDDKTRLKEINQRLSELRVEFNKNLLAETNGFMLVITDEADLAGLPDGVIVTAAGTAAGKGIDGSWVFTTHKPSMLPFLTYSEKRDLRKELFTAYTVRGDQDNNYDNKAVIAEIVNLRVEKAKLLGYEDYASYTLEPRMAGTPEGVYRLLDRLWAASLPVAKREVEEMQAIIDAESGGFELAPWDWWYYAEKVRKAKFDLDDNELRPYFELNNVRDGVFHVANKLYGLTFEALEDMPKPHSDAQVFEVFETDGSHAAVIYMDYHPRDSKRGGAWCGRFRSQNRAAGAEVDPVINLVCNFTTATEETPALLSLDEVETLFHEFGHALDGILAEVTYRTSFRSPDFGELPSQIMEHWATHPDVLRVYARHYQTGEPIPDALIAKIEKSATFNQGFIQVEYLAASLLDMEYHTLTGTTELDINAFEKAYFDEIGLIPEIVSRYRTTYFAHIVGGYAAGYYGYTWSGVLDHDAFAAFEETSLFDQETAQRFRSEILEVSGTADYIDMWVNFRGREPDIEPMLRNLGLL